MPPGVGSAESGGSPKAQVSDGGTCWRQARGYYLILLLSFYLLSSETLRKKCRTCLLYSRELFNYVGPRFQNAALLLMGIAHAVSKVE